MLEELQQYFLYAIRSSTKARNVGSELSIVLKLKDENTLSYTYDTVENYNLTVSIDSKNVENRVSMSIRLICTIPY